MINRRDMLASASAFALAGTTMAQAGVDPVARTGETNWLHYANDLNSTRYSPLDQINAGNFNKLQVAWRFKTDNFGPAPEYRFESPTGGSKDRDEIAPLHFPF